MTIFACVVGVIRSLNFRTPYCDVYVCSIEMGIAICQTCGKEFTCQAMTIPLTPNTSYNCEE